MDTREARLLHKQLHSFQPVSHRTALESIEAALRLLDIFLDFLALSRTPNHM